MKRFIILTSIATVMIAASCSKQTADTSATKDLDMANLDTSAIPGSDFYRFATGGWSDANPIPDEYSRYGSFDKLREDNQKQIKELIEELGKTEHPKGSVAEKIGNLYKIGMDSVKINKDGHGPIKG